MEVTEMALAEVFATMAPLLDERQRRAFAGAQASAFGRGGIAAVCRASGMSRATVQKAVSEVAAGLDPNAP
ncbi:MAG: ISAzo13 family transposase, partial [Acidimicrobiales bacterium]